MSIRALTWASDTDLTGSTRWVLMALANYANDEDGSCFPGQAKIAKFAGVSERTAREQLAKLEADGWIERKARYDDQGWRTSDRYRLRFDRLPDPTTGSPRDLPADSVPPTGETRRASRTTSYEPSDVEPSERASALVQVPAGDDFERFWAVFPRKAGKEAARKAYAKLARTFGGLTILEGAQRFAADPNLPEKQFIPHPATWLNRHGWEDEPLPSRGGQEDERSIIERARQRDGL